MKINKGIAQIKWSYLLFLSVFILTSLFLCGCGEDTGEATSIQATDLPAPGSPDDVVLAWDAPVTREDGSPLTNLDGYKVYYGMETGSYDEVIDVGENTLCSISGLSTGTWYFAVTAYDYYGNESDYSNEVLVTLPLE